MSFFFFFRCLRHHRHDIKNKPVRASCLTKGRLARQIGANSDPTCRWQRIRGQFCTLDQTINELLPNCQASGRINHNQFKYLPLFVWISQKHRHHRADFEETKNWQFHKCVLVSLSLERSPNVFHIAKASETVNKSAKLSKG